MSFQTAINQLKNQPRQLEDLYQSACQQGAVEQFTADLQACLADDPENLVLQAWQYRLAQAPAPLARRVASPANWQLAVPLAILTGLIFWALSGERFQFPGNIPYILLLGAPIAALFVIAYLIVTARVNYRRAVGVSLGLAACVGLGVLLYYQVALRTQSHYLVMLILHVALLSWVGVGVVLVGLKKHVPNRFAFLIRSLEVFVVGGVYLAGGIAFGTILVGMFAALSIDLPEVWQRLVIAGGLGLIPLLAVATIYDPHVEPHAQDFTQGLSKLIATMMRLFLPLTLAVLVVYLFIIPFNFMEPFNNRDVLIVYNVMLFAVLGLLISATPMELGELSPRLGSALRGGILAVAGLAALISLYALSALVYRTVGNGLSLNRLIMLGWNAINIVLLILMIVRLLKKSDEPWNERLKAIYSLAAIPYVVWALFVILVTPFIFR